MKKSDEQLLLTFERKVLRTIFGAMREGERWRRRYNFELKRDFGEPDLVAVVKVQRLRWAGQLARIDRNRAPQCYSEIMQMGEVQWVAQKCDG